MKNVFLGLGSNIGDRYKILQKAVKSLSENHNIELIKQSSIFETEPFGYKEQPDFLNMVIEISTSLQPMDLLAYINEVEEKHERKRDIHWGPRTIDIDILLSGTEIIKSKNLEILIPKYVTIKLKTKPVNVVIKINNIFSNDIILTPF